MSENQTILGRCIKCLFLLPIDHVKKSHNITQANDGYWYFHCNICLCKIVLQSSAIEHVRRLHKIENIYRCNDCQAYFTFEGLKNHKKIVHKVHNKEETAEKTGNLVEISKPHMPHAEILKQHQKISQTIGHKQNLGQNSKSQNQEVNKISTVQEANKNNENKYQNKCVFSFKCKICHAEFTGKNEIIDHIDKKHDRKKWKIPSFWYFKCNICLGQLVSQTSAIEHVKKLHYIKNIYCCNDCQAYFTLEGLNQHSMIGKSYY